MNVNFRRSLFWIAVVGIQVCAVVLPPLPSYESWAAVALVASAERPVDFIKDIQPILKRSCYRCHGAEMQMGQLRLDAKALVFQGGISGKVIVPGMSQHSLLFRRVLGLGDTVRMPLEGDPLTKDQIDLIRAWIDQGASWPDEASVADAKISKHWAYVKPIRRQLPEVESASWVRNPIDNFVMARLEKEGLKPSAEASREALVRRVSLDLTGLPPSIEEVNAFLTDESPDAYEKVVDRLLASPHYGERWARPWMDMARYSDTDGVEEDLRRSIWKYRDWVINALNQDMSFTQFTIEQIAGDMLPDATIDQKIASGFHRNTAFRQNEGGFNKEEERWERLIDRVNTTASVWLGTTLACAQCHNHKYDPFSQKEYYQFLAFFENVDETKLELPKPEQQARHKTLREEIGKLEAVMQTQTPELEAAQALWEREGAAQQANWRILNLVDLTSSGGASFKKAKDKSILVTSDAAKETYTIVTRTDLKGITAFQLEVLPDNSLPAHGPGSSKDGNFILTAFKVEAASSAHEKITELVGLKNPRVDFSQQGYPIADVLDDSSETGWGIWPQVGRAHAAVLETKSPIGDGNGTTLTFTLGHQSQNHHAAIGRFRLSASTTKDPLPAPPLPDHVRRILSNPDEKRTEGHKKELSSYYRSIAPLLEPVRRRLSHLNDELEEMQVVSTLVMREIPSAEKPSAYMRVRGNFLRKGERVFANVPAALHPLPESQLATRLGLAHWLADENNPLVARVTVNHIWGQYFGRGIVETAENFGIKGEPPTHPELLDWLATEFMRQGWSMKAMHRLIVTSATYRQSSQVTPALLERDPYNKLLARSPRIRMEGEMIRDVALAVSGLLSRKIGGPSVFPYQPEGIWTLPQSDDKWVISKGEDRYRRGLYTFWRRTAPYPLFMTFDAPSREVCAVRRINTNTPLQALATLNDPGFFDAARALARRLMTEEKNNLARADYGFRLCVSRHPSTEELNLLVEAYKRQLDHFRKDIVAARKVIKGFEPVSAEPEVAEFAAWAMVSNALLNLDETMTKE
jgi:Protein of unknown function (DUF1553)/Protein of unknown function (DUF1549)/Planctomycete cytochrome C